MKNNISYNDIELDQTDIPPGQIRRRIGDVFNYAKREYVVEFVSASRAVARCLAKSKAPIIKKLKGIDSENTLDEAHETIPNMISISTCCDRQDVIRRIENYQSPSHPSSAPCK